MKNIDALEFTSDYDLNVDMLKLIEDADLEILAEESHLSESFFPRIEENKSGAEYFIVPLQGITFKGAIKWAEEHGAVVTDPREVITIFKDCDLKSINPKDEGTTIYLVATKTFNDEHGDDTAVCIEISYGSEKPSIISYETYNYDSIEDYLIFRVT